MRRDRKDLADERAKAKLSWPSEPYKGLNFFTSEDAPLFSQREDAIEECAARVDDFTTRVLILHGLSGMGKSSFLRAGLIPRLENPPGDGTKFRFLRDTVDVPLIIRTTDRPLTRLREVLAETTSKDERIPSDIRIKMRKILEHAPAMETAKSWADRVLFALKLFVGSEKTRTLAIVFDQAEEILTLPQETTDARAEHRLAFFYFLEEICRRNLDCRAVISLRTEYYGQFCCFFSDPPSYRINSEALPLSGLRDYYLHPIRSADQIAEIIKLPTSNNSIMALTSPREKYCFEYARGVPEMIAADLLKLLGDFSILPVLQVVCKKLYERCADRSEFIVRIEDYLEIGGVEGSLDHYIDGSLRACLADGGQVRCQDIELARWRKVLCNLIGHQEGGAITGLILNARKLIEVAQNEKVSGDPKSVIMAMAKNRSPLLRVVGQGDGGIEIYGLSHDCIAGALARWAEKYGEVLKAEQLADRVRTEAERCLEQEKRDAQRRLVIEKRRFARRLRQIAIVSGVALVSIVSTLTISYSFAAIHFALDNLDIAAEAQDSSKLRDRLMMLIVASKRTEGWPWSIFPFSYFVKEEVERTETELSETLLRAPIFGGSFPAVLDLYHDQVAYFDYGNRSAPSTAEAMVRVQDLALPPPNLSSAGTAPGLAPTEVRSTSIDPALLKNIIGGGNNDALRPPPVIGYLALSSPSAGPPTPLIAVSPGSVRARGGVLDWVSIVVGSEVRQFPIPPKEAQQGDQSTRWPPQVEFGNGSIRLISFKTGELGLPVSQSVERVIVKNAQYSERVRARW